MESNKFTPSEVVSLYEKSLISKEEAREILGLVAEDKENTRSTHIGIYGRDNYNV